MIKTITRLASYAYILAATLGLLSATPTYPYYDQAAPDYGVRTVAPVLPGGLTVTGDSKGTWGDAKLTWTITPENGLLRYTYLIEALERPALSHFTLDISNNCTIDPSCVTSARVRNEGEDWVDIDSLVEIGTLDGITGAVKFDVGGMPDFSSSVTFTFLSNRTPVYGDFFVKAGASTTLTNSGFGNMNGTSHLMYVARPDTGYVNDSQVPEPGSLVLLCTGSIVLFAGKFGRRLIRR